MSDILAFINRSHIQLLAIMAIIGIFVGTGLIMSQLRSTLVRSLGQAIVATAISLIILSLVIWITNIGTLIALMTFCLLFAVLLWIMRFRMVSDLFIETVRIVRVALVLAIVIGLVVWIVL